MEDCKVLGEKKNEMESKWSNIECKHQRGQTCSTNFSEESQEGMLGKSEVSKQNQQGQDAVYNFKKTHSKVLSLSQSNKNREVSSKEIKIQKSTNKTNILSHDISQLQDIERRTQTLVLKEKEHRKELKKLKKLYEAKLQEYQTLKTQFQEESENYNFKLHQLQKQVQEMSEETQNLKNQIQLLEDEICAVEQKVAKEKEEKDSLWRKLEVMEANCQCRYQQKQEKEEESDSRIEEIININGDLQSLKEQIDLIDKKIEQKQQSAQTETDLKEIISLFDLRKGYHSKIEALLIEQERKKSERVIFKLNRIIVNDCKRKETERQESSKTKNIEEIEMVESVIYHEEDKEDKAAETSDSFFGGTFQESKYNQTAQSWSKCYSPNNSEEIAGPSWNQLKIQMSNVIDEARLIGFEEVYDNMDELVVGLMNLVEVESEPEHYLALVRRIMSQTNDFFSQKAQKHCSTIDKLMKLVSPTVKQSDLNQDVQDELLGKRLSKN